jgi:hypothetical protein
MSLAIIKFAVTLDGVTIDDFKSVSENEIEVGKEIVYATKTGYANVRPKYGFKAEYVPPQTGAFDWSKARDNDVTATFTYDGGTTATYFGGRLLKKGEGKLDGDNELTYPLDFTATSRDPAL